jgi:cytochrome P450
MGGFDTTSIALQHAFYNLIRHRSYLTKLRAEIDAAYANGTLSLSGEVRYLDTLKLPFLGACIQESWRLTMGVFGFPRTVPPGGCTLSDGTVLPGGVDVTLNPDVVHFASEIFGERSEEYIPERWLVDPNVKDQEAEKERVRLMEYYFLMWGAGSRMCLGKVLASMEVWKLVVVVLRGWEVELLDDGQGNGGMRLRYEWFKRVDGMNVKVRKRVL